MIDAEEIFAGFAKSVIETKDVRFSVLSHGRGPAVLLLHGYPETRAAWHRIAPMLAQTCTVVVPDLPGYGRSRVIADFEGAGSKRRMAASLVAMMRTLGHETFAVVGHDRGGRVAYRMALDFPDRVKALVSVTVVPTPEMWEGASKAFGMGAWHWFMMAQPVPLPEKLMASDPRYLLDTTLEKMAGGLDRLDPRAIADYRACFDDPAVRHAMCEDYRAGATTDEADDLADRAARRLIEAPVLLIWEAGRRYGGGREPLDIWREWASNVEGVGLEGGHLLPETASEQLRERIQDFFGRMGYGL